MGLYNSAAMGIEYLILAAFRFAQFVLGITVCGLYGVDLHAASSQGKYADSKWVYAVVVGALGAFTALLYMIPFMMRVPFAFVWDFIMFFLWVVLFGIFGKMYIHEDAEGDSGVQRMKNAVWVDLTNTLLWLFTAVLMAGYWWRIRKERTTFTGRGRQHV